MYPFLQHVSSENLRRLFKSLLEKQNLSATEETLANWIVTENTRPGTIL